MDDVGAVTLASVVSQGYLVELKSLCLHYNDDITDQGMTALARAIDVRGLPMLEAITMDGISVTTIGVGAIMDALMKRCPRCKDCMGPTRGGLG